MVNLYHTFESLKYLAAGAVTSVMVGIIVYLIYYFISFLSRDREYRHSIQRDVFEGFLVAVPLSYLAWVVGYLTGFSHSGVVSELVPAVLTFIGASAAILSLKFSLILQSSMIILSFSTCLFVGATLGSSLLAMEKKHENRLHLQYLKEQADVEAVVKAYRESLGLEWPPTYSLPTGAASD